MVQHISVQIAIVGAGVVGLTIADYAVMPVGTPSVLMDLPSLLFNRNSPLAIRPGALAALTPWLTRFALQSLPGPARRNGQAIAGLLAGATPLWRDLAGKIGALDLFEDRGCLYLYETAAAFRAAEADMAARRNLGVEVELITPATLTALEPDLPEVAGGAAFFPGSGFLTDPGAMMDRLRLVTMQHAGFLSGQVDRLTRQIDGVILEGDGFRLHARQVILATGAHGKALAAMAGDTVPLETERGYHVEWDMPYPAISRPCCPTARGFYFCPMQGRLRVAGTVELGGLTAPPSQHRIDRLIEGARAFFPLLGEPDRTWLGFRPSMPDSLPVISPSRGGADVILAFGHGHIGVTLAPITARIVADLVAGRTPERDITAFRPNRF